MKTAIEGKNGTIQINGFQAVMGAWSASPNSFTAEYFASRGDGNLEPISPRAINCTVNCTSGFLSAGSGLSNLDKEIAQAERSGYLFIVAIAKRIRRRAHRKARMRMTNRRKRLARTTFPRRLGHLAMSVQSVGDVTTSWPTYP